jgi:hypothetical protein
MKKIISVCFMLFATNYVIAQEVGTAGKNSLKVYSLVIHEKNNFTTVKPSFAFQWRNKQKDYHEIELISFQFDKYNQFESDAQNGFITKDNLVHEKNISLRYEYIFSLNKKENVKLMPAIGLGINPFFYQMNTQARISNVFPTNNVIVGTRIFLIPRLVYNLNKRFYLDVNTPINVSELNYQFQKVDNPSYNINERTSFTGNYYSFPAYFSGRIGLGFRI